ncbi:hypothetical protein ATERTT37_007653 [Aspergillus terreus]
MSPEMFAILSSAQEDADPPPDKPTPATGPLQAQANANPSLDPFTSAASRSDSNATHGSSALWEKLNGSTVSVASTGASVPIVREGTETPGGQSSESEEFRVANGMGAADAAKFSGAALSSKDGREVKKVKSTSVKARTTTSSTNVSRAVSGSRRHAPDAHDGDGKEHRTTSGLHGTSSRGAAIEKTKAFEALTWLLELFSKLASGYFALSRYKCVEAIQIFNALSQGQRETPWVLSQIGRAYYEQAMYSDAEKYFIKVRTMAPSRLEDMEIYSTVLWHLKNDVELAYLAHELMEVDRLSPQAWCAIGNSFSHQRDHDQALKCFKRATQLDPQFAYGFTLQGHEYVANEEYDKALDAYRNGISADSRHYNAWYGLGTVYDKMGKLDFAEQHFRNAASINPTNAVLICCIGLVLEKMDNPKAALHQYGRACSIAPHSVLARFRKARALMKLQELKLALTELKILKDMAPDEANVHYLLGKLYKMVHDKGNAIKHFTTALNLDPKAAQYIKDAMESLDDDEEDDEDMA